MPDEGIEWITVHGNHIPIMPGEDRGEAIKQHFANDRGEHAAGERTLSMVERESSGSMAKELQQSKVAEAESKWESEETITGHAVIETREGFDTGKVSETDAAGYIKANGNQLIDGISSSKDIEDVSIKGIERGEGFVRIKYEVTPTVDAGARWLDKNAGSEEWNLYHER